MHYSSKAFAIDKQVPTIWALNGEIKPLNELSATDVQEIRQLYNCLKPPAVSNISLQGFLSWLFLIFL
jgi:hypothetical protein